MNKLTPLVKGIITGAIMVIASLILFYSNLPVESRVHYIVYLLFAAGIAWTLISYFRSASFTGKFADLFGQGFRCFIVIILIMAAFTAIFSMLHPEFAEEEAKYHREALIKERNTMPDQIDKLVSDAKKQYTTRAVYFTIFGYLMIGTVVTAAGSALLMRRK